MENVADVHDRGFDGDTDSWMYVADLECAGATKRVRVRMSDSNALQWGYGYPDHAPPVELVAHLLGEHVGPLDPDEVHTQRGPTHDEQVAIHGSAACR
jgi:hypothetical protein